MQPFYDLFISTEAVNCNDRVNSIITVDKTWRCMCSYVLLIMGGGTAWNTQSVCRNKKFKKKVASCWLLIWNMELHTSIISYRVKLRMQLGCYLWTETTLWHPSFLTYQRSSYRHVARKVWLRTAASLVSEQACTVKTSLFPLFRTRVWSNFERVYFLFYTFAFQYVWLSPQHITYVNFMIALCSNGIKHFIFQLMHTNYKILRLLK